MKKLKLLPSMLMLIVCLAVLCVGVFSLTPTENTIGGTINISSMARVKLTCYVDEEVVYDSQNTAYGVDWDLTDTALNFDVSKYSDAKDVPLRTIRIRIQNLTGLHLGVYFYNGNETTLQTINGEKYATYDSLQLSDAVYKANSEETDENKLVDVYLSPYGYIAPANGDDTYDEYDMFINFDVVNLDITEVSKVISYMLRIEEYKSNVTIDGGNVATFTPLEGRTKQLVKLPTNNTNTTTPTLAGASYGNVVIPTTYTSIPASGLSGCTGLTNIAIPQSITNIGESALLSCSALRSVDYHIKGEAQLQQTDMWLVLPNGLETMNFGNFVKTIPPFICYGVSTLRNLNLGSSVESIGYSAFACFTVNYGGSETDSALTTLTIPASLKDIGTAYYWEGEGDMYGTAFDGCAFRTLVIPETVEHTYGSFGWCPYLEEVTIYANLNDTYVFNYCRSLKKATLKKGVSQISGSYYLPCDDYPIETVWKINDGNGWYDDADNVYTLIDENYFN